MMVLTLKLTSVNNQDAVNQIKNLSERIRAELATAIQPGQWEGKEARTASTLIEWSGTYTPDHTTKRLHGDIFGRQDGKGNEVRE